MGCQWAPASVVFQTPPDTPPVHMMSGLIGSNSRTRVRPPMLPGPRKLQEPMLPVETSFAPAGSLASPSERTKRSPFVE